MLKSILFSVLSLVIVTVVIFFSEGKSETKSKQFAHSSKISLADDSEEKELVEYILCHHGILHQTQQ